MLRRILIANRGEIALRVLRTCKEMGIETVCVYSEQDRDAIYLRYADESICIGPGPAAQSYLDIPRIIAAAEIADVEAIHPGYGFLSENADFAEVCHSCGIAFIGPPPEAIAAVGDKARARELARQAEVPVLPGSEGVVRDVEQGLRIAREIGFPVMIKAAAGGGGRGMRVAHSELAFTNGFLAARSEAEAAFKDGSLYLEKYIEGARHIEIQVLADAHGGIVHLGERDCSLQRRHQKLIEEAPSPFVDEELRARMGAAAVRLARLAGYRNAGTAEFLVGPDRRFYFIEMNARIQVEHPVTEMVCGIDLVREQIRIAAGEPLGYTQSDVRLVGAAIECRINAEDPDQNFKPSPGRVSAYVPPGGRGVRLDSHVYAGYTIPPHYDSMVAKLIAYGADRAEAIAIMSRALGEFVIEGVRTTIPLHRRILATQEFRRGEVSTTFVEERFRR
ncbi:MAG: acetyl-CoA carboxylase biotin carboxylase subunit [Planctomycetota bacterium]|nr:MAG: acetyl-CoA carboxylase biotin carboxylase subunit [Planctomycetota bacterium]